MKNQTHNMIILTCVLLLLSTVSAQAQTQTETGTRNLTTAPDSVTVSTPISTARMSPGSNIKSSLYGTAINVSIGTSTVCRNVAVTPAAYAKGTATGYWPWISYGKPTGWNSFISNPPASVTVSLCSSGNCTLPAIGSWEECNAGQEQNFLPTPVTSDFFTAPSVGGPPTPGPGVCGTLAKKCEFNCPGPYRYRTGALNNECYSYTCAATMQPANTTKCSASGAPDADPYDETFLTANTSWTTVLHNNCNATKCQYECSVDGYRVGAGGACEHYDCQNLGGLNVTNATSCFSLGSDPNDESPLYANTDWSLTNLCAVGTYCQYQCNSGYHASGNTCIPYSCVNPPADTTDKTRCSTIGDLTDESGLLADTNWNTVAACTGAKCEYTCAAGKSWNGSACVTVGCDAGGEILCHAVYAPYGTPFMGCCTNGSDYFPPFPAGTPNEQISIPCGDNGQCTGTSTWTCSPNGPLWTWALTQTTCAPCPTPPSGTIQHFVGVNPGSCLVTTVITGGCSASSYNNKTFPSADGCADLPTPLNDWDTQQINTCCPQGASYVYGGPMGMISSYTCLSTCLPTCGNGAIGAGEQCDDSNTVSSDGCSATCQCDGATPVASNGHCCPTGNAWIGGACIPAGCGNGTCDAGETVANCPGDCGCTYYWDYNAPMPLNSAGCNCIDAGIPGGPTACPVDANAAPYNSALWVTDPSDPHPLPGNAVQIQVACTTYYSAMMGGNAKFMSYLWSANCGAPCTTQSLDVGSSQTMSFVGAGDGAVSTPGCPSGYTGAPQRTCNAGTWGALQGTPCTPSSVVCGNGTCEASETCWNGSTGCQADCGDCACTTQSLDVGSGQSMSYTAGPSGTFQTPGCPGGYIGAPERSCNLGTWSAELGTPCTPSGTTCPMTNTCNTADGYGLCGGANYIYFNATTGGQVATSTGCPAGYAGNATMLCDAAGNWDMATFVNNCSLTSCPLDLFTFNGRMFGWPNGQPGGTTKTYGCDFLSGNPSAIGTYSRPCTAGGWGAIQYTCQCAGATVAGPGGPVLVPNTDFGDFVPLANKAMSCVGGETGKTGVVCQYGVWSGLTDQCVPNTSLCNYNGILDNGETGIDCGGTYCPACTITVTVNTHSLPVGVQGQAYSATLSATGGTPPYTWSLNSGSLPAGLSLAANGVISGTPSATGASYNIVFKANDSAAHNAVSGALSINIVTPVTMVTNSLPAGVTGTHYVYWFQATGGSGSYNWTIVSGSVPPGIDYPAGAVAFVGDPNTPGNYPLVLKVSDGLTSVQSASMTLTITGIACMLNGIKDNGETGIDCGGGGCGACPVCNNNTWQDNGETGIDCGGGGCPACLVCNNNGISDNGEIGIDCGGGSCLACPACNHNGIQDNRETGIDCGGGCPACPCNFNGISDNGETGIDCGGGGCPACYACNSWATDYGCFGGQVGALSDFGSEAGCGSYCAGLRGSGATCAEYYSAPPLYGGHNCGCYTGAPADASGLGYTIEGTSCS